MRCVYMHSQQRPNEVTSHRKTLPASVGGWRSGVPSVSKSTEPVAATAAATGIHSLMCSVVPIYHVVFCCGGATEGGDDI